MKVTTLGQILSLIDREDVTACITEHQSDYRAKKLKTWPHLISMLFCHLAKATSLRDVEFGLRAAASSFYHLGMQRAPCKSTLAYNNENRSYKVFEALYYRLLKRFSKELGIAANRLMDRKIYMLDSTLISVTLSLFDWAKYRTQKGAIKLHTVMDYDTCLPTYLHLTPGNVHDAQVAKTVSVPAGSVIVADRAYLDYTNLYRWHRDEVQFVTRTKKNMEYEVGEDLNLDSSTADSTEMLADYQISLINESKSKYPEPLRVVSIRDPKTNQQVDLLTNNFTWTAQQVGELYKARWSIETFFKTIKQHLHIQSFLGTSQNAVLIQIYTAMISILLMKVLHNRAKHNWQLCTMVAMIRVQLLSKIVLMDWLNVPLRDLKKQTEHTGQKEFDFEAGDSS